MYTPCIFIVSSSSSSSSSPPPPSSPSSSPPSSSSSSSSSYSSSTGTTARCGFWPVEHDPSIFSCLSPTISIIFKSIQLFPLFDFRNNKFFTVWGC
jgi:hypothetical protein